MELNSIELNLKNKYNYLVNNPSDINEHLPTLYKYAKECESIIECGVRGCVSSWALTYGLLHNNKSKKKILLNDINKCNINELIQYSINLNIELYYKWENDLDLDIKENFDLIFIDTWHVYGQLKRELNKFSPIINKYIILHDTTIDEIYGESIRHNNDLKKESLLSNIPEEEISCGLGKAITEFLELNKNWELYEKFTNNNGLTILHRIN